MYYCPVLPTRTQITDFGMVIVKGGSPSLDLLHDLQKKRLPLDHFVACLQRIGCQRALNEFTAASESSYCESVMMNIYMYIWLSCLHGYPCRCFCH